MTPPKLNPSFTVWNSRELNIEMALGVDDEGWIWVAKYVENPDDDDRQNILQISRERPGDRTESDLIFDSNSDLPATYAEVWLDRDGNVLCDYDMDEKRPEGAYGPEMLDVHRVRQAWRHACADLPTFIARHQALEKL